MQVKQWLSLHQGHALLVQPGTLLAATLDLMLTKPGCRDLFVVDEKQQVVGHISFKRLTRHLLAEHRPDLDRRSMLDTIVTDCAEDLMESHFVSARPGESLDEVLHRVLEHDMEDMPVLNDDGRLLGTINIIEVLGCGGCLEAE